MLIDNGPQSCSSVFYRGIDIGRHRIARTLATYVCVLKPPRCRQWLRAGIAFRTEATEIGGMVFIATDLDDAIVDNIHDNAAADTAIGTYRFDASRGHDSRQPNFCAISCATHRI